MALGKAIAVSETALTVKITEIPGWPSQAVPPSSLGRCHPQSMNRKNALRGKDTKNIPSHSVQRFGPAI